MFAQFQNALDANLVPVLTTLGARPARDNAGNPIVVAGNNALVARLRRTDGHDIALRILASPGKRSDFPVRYASLGEFVRDRDSHRFPQHMSVVRDPLGDGSVADGVLMEWIPGPTLAQAVDRAVRTANTSVLRALQVAFVRLWNDLVRLEFTHADLVPSNIMVRSNGQLALVDLDGASWPGAPFAPAGEGAPAYRHPGHGRQADVRDPFAALVIVASLAILADAPDLKRVRAEASVGDESPLFFSSWDLAHAQNSRGIHEAIRRARPQSASILQALVSASVGGLADVAAAIESVPGMEVPAAMQASNEATQGWDVSPVVERMRAHYTSTWNQPAGEAAGPVRDLTQGPRDRHGVVAEVWPSWRPVEPELANQVPADAIADLEKALARNDEAEVIRIWGIVGHDPLAAMFAAEVEGVFSTSYDRRILEEASRHRDTGVIALGDEAASRQIPLGPRARTSVRQARERVDVQARLDQALASNDRDALADLAISGQLVVLGDTDRASLERVIQAIEWPVLQRAIDADDDVLIDAAFDDELFGNDATIDPVIRSRVELARERLQWMSEVRDALAQRNSERLAALFMTPPAQAAERLGPGERRRIRRMIEQSQAIDHLHDEIKRGEEAGIVSALNRVERVSARISDRATWAAIQHVVERVTLIDDLLDVAQEEPLDYGRIAQLLPAVRALGLEQDPRLGRSDFVANLEHQLVRMAHVRRIQAAIARDNDIAIVTAAIPDPHDALDLLNTEERDRVAAAIRARKQTARSRQSRSGH